ncbi:MAG: DUF4278 domain-containing protein [Cyanobacteriota bacterium]|nr:DUF4278 domain-containing protein [Cyanobacteriota bacterium]
MEIHHIGFLIPLALALGARYIAQKSEAEIAYLTAVLTLIFLLVSLLLAPWQIQILLLLITAVAVRQFWLQLQPAPTAPISPEKSRQYRGISYEAPATPPPPEPQGEKVAQCYRGVTYSACPAAIPSAETKTPAALKYRGVSLAPPGPSAQDDSPAMKEEADHG